MQQRLAFSLLVRMKQSPLKNGVVQAADAPANAPEVVYFRALRQLKRRLENLLLLHDSPQLLRIQK